MERKIISIDQFKKEKKSRLIKEEKEKDKAVEGMSQEKFFIIVEVLEDYNVDRESLRYKTAFAELKEKPKKEVVDIINQADEDAVEKKPEYYKAALDVVLGKSEEEQN